MAVVKFEDVATRVNAKEDRHNTDLVYYVGGDHIDSESLKVSKRGIIKGAPLGPMFYFGFKPGDILFVTRNPHLRKCAVVDFAGICSEKTLVIATKDETVLCQKYLAGVMQSDDFWDFLEENKSGSVNYFINWSTLAEYEFDLPPIEEQRALAEKLWAANDLKEKYQHLLAATDEMLKAKFREMFGECGGQGAECGVEGRQGGGLVLFKECYAKMLGGKTPSMSRPDFYGGTIPFVKSGDVRGDYLSNGALWLSDAALKEGGAKYVPAGSVIVVVRSATLKNELRVAIANNELVINQDLKAFVPQDEFDSQFLMHAIRLRTFELLSKVQTMVTSHLEISDLDQILIPKVPICVQREFVAIANAAEASKAELKKVITKAQSIDFRGEYDLTVDGHVIFVDDLERVADVGKEQDGRLLMDIIGRLFDEFISRGYHVVFIGAESEMGNKPRFFAEKEKYIRHTIDFAPNIPNVISSIVESHRGVARHHARLVASFLRSFAKTYHVDNIRTIKRILDSFIFLAEKVNDEALLSKSADKIMEILAPTVNERAAGVFRGKSTDDILAQTKSGGASGNLDEKEWCKSLVALYNHFYTSEGEGKIGAEDSSAKQTERLGDYVKNRYKRQSCLCKWSENSSIVYFAITGLIDNDSLKRELLSWIPPPENQYLKALDIVWQFESIEDDDFKKMCPIVIDGLKSGQYNAEHANLAYSLIYHFNQNGWMSIDCENLIRETVSALESRWGVMPDDYINPMLLHNRQEDFLQPIIDVIQAEKVRREKKLANDEVQKFLDALENKDKDAVWSICPECQTCLIFDKIVESNKSSEFCSVSNWALHLVWYVLKEREPFIRPSSRNSIERLVEEFDKTIQACDNDRPLRKARLKEVYERFAEILNKPEFKRSSDDSCAQKH